MIGRGVGLRSRALAWVFFAAMAASQVGCGGGGDGAGLSVPVASGYPILGSTVTVKGSNGASISVVGNLTTGIASFSAPDVASLGSPPFLIKSTGGTANGVASTSDYYSIAKSSSGRVNVTPITHLLAVQATGTSNLSGLAALFNAPVATGFNTAKAATLNNTALATALTSVKQALIYTNPLIDLGSVDPLTVAFTVGDAQDALLDQVQLTLKSAGATLDAIQAYVATTAAGGVPVTSALKPFNRMVVFGDSLSDGGSYTAWASGAASGANRFIGATPLQMLAAAAPYGGKFTTNPGKVWVENIAASLGYDMKPASLMGGGVPTMNLSLLSCTTCTNYAQGGSRVVLQPGIGNVGTTANPSNAAVPLVGFGGNVAGAPVAANPVLLGAAVADYGVTNTFLGASTLPVKQQIDQHLASTYVSAGRFAATDLVIVMAGANDVFTQAGLAGAGAITSNNAGQAVGTAASALVTQIARIKAAGAKHVLVVGLPDMGVNPYASASGTTAAAALTSLSQAAFNATLKAGLASVPGVAYFDPVPLFSKVVASPSTYGFTTVIDGTSPLTALASTACGPNVIAQVAAADSAASPSSLYCSVANSTLSLVGTLRALLADQTYIFADGVHPSTQMHKVLAQNVQEKLGLLLINAMVP